MSSRILRVSFSSLGRAFLFFLVALFIPLSGTSQENSALLGPGIENPVQDPNDPHKVGLGLHILPNWKPVFESLSPSYIFQASYKYIAPFATIRGGIGIVAPFQRGSFEDNYDLIYNLGLEKRLWQPSHRFTLNAALDFVYRHSKFPGFFLDQEIRTRRVGGAISLVPELFISKRSSLSLEFELLGWYNDQHRTFSNGQPISSNDQDVFFLFTRGGLTFYRGGVLSYHYRF